MFKGFFGISYELSLHLNWNAVRNLTNQTAQ